MPTLLILSKHADLYQKLVKDAQLHDLTVQAAVSASAIAPASATAEIVFGEPSLIAPVLPRLPAVRWIQSTWAGVEPLLNPELRRDYILTNARGVFGALMSAILGWRLPATVLAICVPMISYTTIGGVQAVAWTDVKQMFIVVFGMCPAITASSSGT